MAQSQKQTISPEMGSPTHQDIATHQPLSNEVRLTDIVPGSFPMPSGTNLSDQSSMQVQQGSVSRSSSRSRMRSNPSLGLEIPYSFANSWQTLPLYSQTLPNFDILGVGSQFPSESSAAVPSSLSFAEFDLVETRFTAISFTTDSVDASYFSSIDDDEYVHQTPPFASLPSTVSLNRHLIERWLYDDQRDERIRLGLTSQSYSEHTVMEENISERERTSIHPHESPQDQYSSTRSSLAIQEGGEAAQEAHQATYQDAGSSKDTYMTGTSNTIPDLSTTALTDPSVKQFIHEERMLLPDHAITSEKRMELPAQTNLSFRATSNSSARRSPATDFLELNHPLPVDRWPDRPDTLSETEDDGSVDIESSEEGARNRMLLHTSDEVSTNRLVDPEKYFDKLESLEREIYQNSALKAHKNLEHRSIEWITSFTFLNQTAPFFVAVSKLQSAFSGAYDTGKVTLGLDIWCLLHCYQTLGNAALNVRKLQKCGYCGDQINLLSLSTERSNCVRLLPVPVSIIDTLIEAFENARSQMEHAQEVDELFFSRVTASLTDLCKDFLEVICLWDVGIFGVSRPIGIWMATIQVLDLAIISYVGAHIEPFDERYLSDRVDFGIPFPFTSIRPTHKSIQSPRTLTCRRQSLGCLDAFLRGKQVWVFSLAARGHGVDERLHLVTKIETFADIWGPLWKVCPIENPEEAFKYRVGHGHIVPWPNQSCLRLDPGERFCHWIATHESYEASEDSFDGSETLVIGAPRVTINRNCACEKWEIKRQFIEYGLLQPLSTSDPSIYVDSHTAEWQVGVPAKGFVAKYAVTWKRREGHFQRTALLEGWYDPKLGKLDPAELEHRNGLEISLATHNARKVPLVNLLGSPSMLEYLRPFPWLDDECEKAYVNAVRHSDPRAFRRLWYDKTLKAGWQEKIRQAVCWCLDALSETGVGIKEEPNTLYVLWVPGPGQRHLVRLKQSKHGWSGFLKDSKVYFTMAVATDKCLDFPHDGAQLCPTSGYSQTGYSVFETALVVAESIQPESLRVTRPKLDQEGVKERCWHVSELELPTFKLGGRGALHPIRRVDQGSVLMEWNAALFQQAKSFVEKGLLMKETARHTEYIQDDRELDKTPNGANGTGISMPRNKKRRVKPLRVFVTSDYLDHKKP